MTADLRIRTGTENDRAFARALGRACVRDSVSSLRVAPDLLVEAAFERLLDLAFGQPHVLFVAERGGALVGFLLMLVELPDEVTAVPQAFVAFMAVKPAERGRGVGARLLAEAEGEAKRRGLPYMALMVTEENAPARRLYERCGFRTERRLLCKAL
jgi:ribosomal protein S18 acetylase RimI-like enzyme